MSVRNILRSLGIRLDGPSVPQDRPKFETLEDRRLLTVTATVTGPDSSDEGSYTGVNLSAYSSNGPNAIAGWFIDWGDGQSQGYSGSTSVAYHIYNDGDDSHTITATVTENTSYGDGSSDTEYKSVTVENVEPIITLTSDATITAGGIFSISQSHTDPGQDTITQWIVNWGDGESTTYPGSASLFNYDDYPLEEGTYNVSVTAVDEDGSYPLSRSVQVTVPCRIITKTDLDLNGTYETTGDNPSLAPGDRVGFEVEVIDKNTNANVGAGASIRLSTSGTSGSIGLDNGAGTYVNSLTKTTNAAGKVTVQAKVHNQAVQTATPYIIKVEILLNGKWIKIGEVRISVPV